jgi:phage N-6-adenine-methyltransferase
VEGETRGRPSQNRFCDGIDPTQNVTKQRHEMATRVGRPRLYHTDAERARAYRQRQRQARRAQAVSVHFKHETTLWRTPQGLFDALDAEFHFTTDVCADASNAKCAHYFSPAQDGLRQRWEGVCWMNPPYGAEIPRWVQKAFEASLYGATVVCLLPARTDTRWFQQYVLPFAEIRYLPGRQRFGESGNSAPFPSAVVIFRPTPDGTGGHPQ